MNSPSVSSSTQGTISDISKIGRAKMLGGNAMDFFGLPPLQDTLADELATALHVQPVTITWGERRLCRPGRQS